MNGFGFLWGFYLGGGWQNSLEGKALVITVIRPHARMGHGRSDGDIR